MATTDVELSVDEAGQALLDPSAYADGTLERACAVLRRASPVHWVESDVFRPFFRLDESRNVETGGVGLGLTIARDVARSHGGDVALAPSPLGGLRVAVRIPV